MKTQNILAHYFAINFLLIQFFVKIKLKLEGESYLGILFYERQYFEVTLNNSYSYSVQY